MMTLEYVMQSTSISYSTLKKYFPDFCGNKRKTKNIISEMEYNKSPKICKACGNKIAWQQRNLVQYCNHSCAARATNKLRYADIQYKEVCCKGCNSKLYVPPSDQRKTFWCSQCDEERVKRVTSPRKVVLCEFCNKQTKNSRFCTPTCWLNSIKKTKSEYEMYVKKCKFKFNVYDYPDFFDIELINNYGWYSPSNKKNNLNGVSRDHCFSVKQGFEQGVNPSIIAHPANCKLLLHRDNQRKNRSCSLTIEQLMKNIESFEEKFSQRPPFYNYERNIRK